MSKIYTDGSGWNDDEKTVLTKKGEELKQIFILVCEFNKKYPDGSQVLKYFLKNYS